MAELECEKAEITARLAENPARVPDVHRGIVEIYERKVTKLMETLKNPKARLDASADIRSLIGKIVLHPGDKAWRGSCHALHGSLMGILDFVNDYPKPGTDRVITKVCPLSRE